MIITIIIIIIIVIAVIITIILFANIGLICDYCRVLKKKNIIGVIKNYIYYCLTGVPKFFSGPYIIQVGTNFNFTVQKMLGFF